MCRRNRGNDNFGMPCQHVQAKSCCSLRRPALVHVSGHKHVLWHRPMSKRDQKASRGGQMHINPAYYTKVQPFIIQLMYLDISCKGKRTHKTHVDTTTALCSELRGLAGWEPALVHHRQTQFAEIAAVVPQRDGLPQRIQVVPGR